MSRITTSRNHPRSCHTLLAILLFDNRNRNSCNENSPTGNSAVIKCSMCTENSVYFNAIQDSSIQFHLYSYNSHLRAFYILSKLQYYKEKTIIFFEVKGWQERHLGLGCTVAQKATWKHCNPHQSLITGSRLVLKFSHFLTDETLWLQCLRSCLQPYKQKTHWHVCRGLCLDSLFLCLKCWVL